MPLHPSLRQIQNAYLHKLTPAQLAGTRAQVFAASRRAAKRTRKRVYPAPRLYPTSVAHKIRVGIKGARNKTCYVSLDAAGKPTRQSTYALRRKVYHRRCPVSLEGLRSRNLRRGARGRIVSLRRHSAARLGWRHRRQGPAPRAGPIMIRLPAPRRARTPAPRIMAMAASPAAGVRRRSARLSALPLRAQYLPAYRRRRRRSLSPVRRRRRSVLGYSTVRRRRRSVIGVRRRRRRVLGYSTVRRRRRSVIGVRRRRRYY